LTRMDEVGNGEVWREVGVEEAMSAKVDQSFISGLGTWSI